MKLISKYKCNATIYFRTIASKKEYNAMASFQYNTMIPYWYTVGKTRDKYCFGSLCAEMKLNFWNLLLELINMRVLVTREEIGKSLNINKWSPSCIKHPRVFPQYVLEEHPWRTVFTSFCRISENSKFESFSNLLFSDFRSLKKD